MKIQKGKVNSPLIIFLSIAFLYGLYHLWKYQNIKSKGIITIGKVKSFKGFKSGVRVYVDVYYNSKVNNLSTRQVDLERVFIGKWILLKIIPERTDEFVVISYDLPPCIDTAMIPKLGWKEFPICE